MATGASQMELSEEPNDFWRKKADEVKKSKAIKDIRKLAIQITAMEKERTCQFFSKKSNFQNEFSPLNEADRTRTEERANEKLKLKQQLVKICETVNRFQRELHNVRPTTEFVEKLKLAMEEIESSINLFKEQQRKRYEELIIDERMTTQEIETLEKKFESWSHLQKDFATVKPHLTGQVSSSTKTESSHLPAEVIVFQKFLEETGGTRGGWDEYDHETFLKFRNRYKNHHSFIGQLVHVLVGRKKEEIENHEQWYQDYLQFIEQKKEAIRKWKEKRQEDKQKILEKVADDSKANEENSKSEQCQKILEEKRERLVKLQKWKIQKEKEKEDDDVKKIKEGKIKIEKQEKERKKQLEMRKYVEDYKKQRQQENEEMKIKKEIEMMAEAEWKQQVAAKEIVKFRERDRKILEERMMQEQHKIEEQKQREKRLEKLKAQVEVEAKRDTSRLYQPTEGWKERMKDKSTSGGAQLHLPHRAIPSWRQGIH